MVYESGYPGEGQKGPRRLGWMMKRNSRLQPYLNCLFVHFTKEYIHKSDIIKFKHLFRFGIWNFDLESTFSETVEEKSSRWQISQIVKGMFGSEAYKIVFDQLFFLIVPEKSTNVESLVKENSNLLLLPFMESTIHYMKRNGK